MIRRHGRTIRILRMFADAVVAMVILLLVSALRFGPDWPNVWQLVVPVPALLVVAYSLAWVGLLALQGLYQSRAHWSIGSEAIGVLKASILLGLITLASLFLLQAGEVSRLVLLLVIPIQAAVTILARSILRSVLRALRRRGRNMRHVLVVGTGPSAVDFASRLEDRWELGFVVMALVGDDEEAGAGRWPVRGPIERLPAILHDLVVDEVAICLPATDRARIDAIARLCVDQGKTVRIPLEIPAAALISGHIEDLDGTPVVSIVSGPDRELSLAAKRLVDIAGAIVGIIVLSPILAVVAIAIKLSDHGPVLFRQPRAGLNGHPFQIAKFRTMVVDADARREALRAFNEIEGNASFKMTNDPRITRVGKFLRKSSIDELPQLWNVLVGEMSLVGPRPHPFDDVAGYDDWHRRRLSMRPGITGLWQIGGRRETSFDRWVEKDLEYIDRWSLWLDFLVIAETIPALIRAEGR
jgi:exopolysaccharide biosynthesis polyprenyl glycosylphosphotransferase